MQPLISLYLSHTQSRTHTHTHTHTHLFFINGRTNGSFIHLLLSLLRRFILHVFCLFFLFPPISLSPSKSFFSERDGRSVLAPLPPPPPPPPPPPLFTSVLHLSVPSPVISVFITDTDTYTVLFNIRGYGGVVVREFNPLYMQYEVSCMKDEHVNCVELPRSIQQTVNSYANPDITGDGWWQRYAIKSDSMFYMKKPFVRSGSIV